MATPSQTRHVNKALVLLGSAQRITNINDGSPIARIADAVWDECRDEVTADHPWNHAIWRRAIAADAAFVPAYAPGQGWTFAYELPADCLLWLPWRRNDTSYFIGELEGGHILSNAEGPLNIRYIRRVEDIAKWSPGFGATFDAKLARYMAKGVTGQTTMVEAMEALYQIELSKARRQDGLSTGRTNRQADFRSSWLGARNTSFGT